jgi:predicted RNA-binding Zn-ribbon protein involved in translation (DUF1610 family)
MRVRFDCPRCGRVAVPPEDVAVRVVPGRTEVLFDCPVCTRVRTTPLARYAGAALLARGAAAVPERATADSPLGLADLLRLQRLLDDDDAAEGLVGGTP